MPDFEITITEPNRDEKLAAIEWARGIVEFEGTDAEYINHVVNQAVESYAKAAGYIPS